MNNKKILEGLAKIAETIPKIANVRIVSAIVLKNDIISIGHATLKTHPLQAKYSSNAHCIHLHAEINAIQRALRIISVEELEKTTIFICRIKIINGKIGFGYSKPCKGCMRAIEAFKISKVVYTLDGINLSWTTMV